MKREVLYAIEELRNAYDRLAEGIGQVDNELTRDGVIQRFEFTFELFWKALKIILKNKGIVVYGPRDCIEEAFRIGLIEDEKTSSAMLKDRNLTVHIYDQETAGEIFERIRTNYVSVLRNMITKLEKLEV